MSACISFHPITSIWLLYCCSCCSFGLRGLPSSISMYRFVQWHPVFERRKCLPRIFLSIALCCTLQLLHFSWLRPMKQNYITIFFHPGNITHKFFENILHIVKHSYSIHFLLYYCNLILSYQANLEYFKCKLLQWGNETELILVSSSACKI